MLSLNDSQKLLFETASQFARTELEKKASEMDEKELFNESAFRKLGTLGLLGITIPETYGGSALGAFEATLAMEALSEACASTTLSYLAHSILCVNNINENASEAQKKKYLPKLVSGEWIGGMGMTEPFAGSDAFGGMKTRAEKKSDRYILNGSKTMITNAPVGDIFVVYARTGNDKKDISSFILEKNLKGFRAGKKLHKMGMRGSPTGELIFENCEVPLENRIGNENESVSHMMRNLNIERITISGISLGIALASVNYVKKYVHERTQFGKHLFEFQMIQEKIASMVSDYFASRATVYNAALAYDKGERQMMLGSVAKLVSAQMGTKVALDAIQILGGWGYMKEYPVERYMRDAKLLEIGAGTNEIMKVLIAREFLNIK